MKISKGLVLFLLIMGLVVIGSSRTDGVYAKTCSEALYDYYVADMNYESARILLFYGSPVSCEQICSQIPAGPEHEECLSECRINRQTELAAAEMNLFSMAGQTCTPEQPDECEQARVMFDGCVATYDYLDYSDPDERLAVYEQFAACREASKIDHCQ